MDLLVDKFQWNMGEKKQKKFIKVGDLNLGPIIGLYLSKLYKNLFEFTRAKFWLKYLDHNTRPKLLSFFFGCLTLNAIFRTATPAHSQCPGPAEVKPSQ